MTVRPATEHDERLLRELWGEFEAEVPAPEGFPPQSWEESWAALRSEIAAGTVFVAEDDEGPLGFADARPEGPEHLRLDTIYVRPRGRRAGVSKALLAEVAAAARAAGATQLMLEVLEGNTVAREVWARLGFSPLSRVLAQPLEQLEARLARPPDGPSRASTHVQSDDRLSVDRTLAQFVPRLEQVEVRASAGGWARIAAPLLDADRAAQSKLAGELSERLGAVVVALALEHGAVVRFKLYERGRMVDEYLSVPTFYGPISKGDELALEANPTLVARLTGAERDQVRQTARTAAQPDELPKAGELYEQLARVMGLEPLKLYDAARCPYCARVRLALAEKEVAYETVELDLRDRPGWIYGLNPSGKVPVLDDGFALPESVAIMEYLDERFPEPALLGAGLEGRARARLAVLRFDDLLGHDYYAYRGGEANELERKLAELPLGESLFVDYAYLPWVMRLRELYGAALPAGVEAWLGELAERPAVAAELAIVRSLA